MECGALRNIWGSDLGLQRWLMVAVVARVNSCTAVTWSPCTDLPEAVHRQCIAVRLYVENTLHLVRPFPQFPSFSFPYPYVFLNFPSDCLILTVPGPRRCCP